MKGDCAISIGATEATVAELIRFALDNSQSGSMEALRAKRCLLAKLDDAEINLTTEEIQIIKASALQTLKDGATIALIEAIAPNDLI